MLFVEPWWRQAAGQVAPRVRAARADATHSVAALDPAGAWVVRIAPGHDQVVTLSHEVAHVLAAVTRGPAAPAEGAHGPRFRAAHVAVATVLLGPHGARLLSAAYRDARLEQLAPPRGSSRRRPTTSTASTAGGAGPSPSDPARARPHTRQCTGMRTSARGLATERRMPRLATTPSTATPPPTR